MLVEKKHSRETDDECFLFYLCSVFAVISQQYSVTVFTPCDVISRNDLNIMSIVHGIYVVAQNFVFIRKHLFKINAISYVKYYTIPFACTHSHTHIDFSQSPIHAIIDLLCHAWILNRTIQSHTSLIGGEWKKIRFQHIQRFDLNVVVVCGICQRNCSDPSVQDIHISSLFVVDCSIRDKIFAFCQCHHVSLACICKSEFFFSPTRFVYCDDLRHVFFSIESFQQSQLATNG